MSKIQIKLVKSSIGSTKLQKKNLEALGLRKMQQTVEHQASPQILGMVNVIKHLVKVTEV